MPILLDKKTIVPPAHLTGSIGDLLKWARTLLPESRVLVKIQRNGELLEGAALSDSRRDSLGDATLTLTSADRKDLALTMLGKLAALIEWLSPQHKDIAAMFERGETQKALDRLSNLFSAWQQIQSAYGNLAKLLEITPKELPVHEVTGETVLNEFCQQLEELQTALSNQDFVLVADILQYEMDGAIANWMALLEATLGIVEPVPA